jgi:hypothetical protein
VSGNLTKWSSATSITNADLSGDITTSGGIVATLATVATAGTNTKITFNAKGLVTASAQAQFSDIGGNIATTQMNSGTGASSTTVWRGDGIWTGILNNPVIGLNGVAPRIFHQTGASFPSWRVSAQDAVGNAWEVASSTTNGADPTVLAYTDRLVLTTSGGLSVASLTATGLSSGLCVQTTTGGLLTTTGSSCGTSSGTVTTTGSPANGNLTKFSGATSITNGDLSGDLTTSGSLVATLASVVSAGTNTKITFNAKGLVTAGAQAQLASADFANQGTTTSVLHGNAAGNPLFSTVNLASEVNGNLSTANLNSGTGANSSTFWRGDGTWSAAVSGVTESTFGWATRDPGVLTNSGSTCPATAATQPFCVDTVFAKGHTLVRLTYVLTVSPAGCTTSPVLGVRDETASTTLASLTIANAQATGFTDSGVLSVATTAGNKLGVGVITAAVGCTQSGDAANLTAVFQ